MKDLLIGVIILLIVGYAVFSVLKSNRDLKKKLKLNYGKIPVHKQQLNMDSIPLYWQQKSNAKLVNHAVDDTTWKDLDMDKIYMRINNTNSSLGDEVLYSTLREQEFNSEKLKKLENDVLYFDVQEDERLQIQYRLSKLGKDPYNGLIDFLFHPDDKRLKYYAIYPVLSFAAFLSVVTIFFNQSLGILFLCIMLVVNIMVYYKTKYHLQSKLNTVRYFSAVMACAKKISKIKSSGLGPYTTKISKLYAPLKTICNLSGVIIYKPLADFDIFEYIKIFFMLDFVLYNQMIYSINKYIDKCIEIYQIIGYLDMTISIASYRRSVTYFSRPEFTQTNEIEIQELIHPLIDHPIANGITLKRNILITGSNASGKSTFVKSLAINAILAQTIHTCLAETFRIQPSFVVTSMAVNDNIETGESYYIAEIKSLKRILDALNKNIRCLCFIDEILKGTNTIERIAASAAILDYLKDKNCFAVVATHDIELTEMTKTFFDNFHFQEKITDNEISFDYKIYEGWATTKNAIRLLDFIGYKKQIIAKGESLSRKFEDKKIWEIL